MSGFVFQWPAMLAFLLLTIPLVLLLAYARKQRRRLIDAMGGGFSTHRRLRDVLRVLAFMLLILALARPGHSPRTEATSRTGRDVVFALDVSQSMLAEDASPSRLEVAKQGVRDALHVLGNERVGLVVYAGSASILCPLTYDYDFVRYMLEQAHPRSVDFGGTTLQSAVEKVVDQVFMEGREGVQDLVVLTDGGDHGSKMTRVMELLSDKQVDVLMVGVGDPNRGSPIRIKDEKGNITLLQSGGQPVYTKLDDASLRQFAAKSARADYVAAGVRPFNLGQLYIDYAAEKSVEAADVDNGVLVYKEAAMFFLIPALVLLLLSECWGARGLQLGGAALWLLCMLFLPEVKAADANYRSGFEAAAKLLNEGGFEDAELQFAELYANSMPQSAQAGDLAALQVNRGLCLMKLSQAQAEQNPGVALSYAEDAQLAFLSAKRYSPTLTRAGLHLESTASWVAELVAQIEAQREADEQLNAEMEALIERLKALLESQQMLRQLTLDKDVNRRQPKRVKNAPPPAPIIAPQDAARSSKVFIRQQAELVEEAQNIKGLMKLLDAKLAVPDTGIPDMDTIMTEPLKLMDAAITSQGQARDLLGAWNSWPAGRAAQQSAEHSIEAILELLAGNSDQESEDSEDMEDYDEDYDYDYMDDSEESMSSSEAMEGDLAAGAEMQELPIPNYSAEDILMEEQGNLQFRQQKRASANAGKVDKDY